MKTSTAILYALVSLCLVFSVTALLIEASDHGFFTPINTPTPIPHVTTPPATQNPTPTPQGTNNPTPTTTTQPTGITFHWTDFKKENLTDTNVKVTLTVTATYNSGESTTISYSDFQLQLLVSRLTFTLDGGTVSPQNSGTVTLGPTHPTETFQLIFEHPLKVSNGMNLVPVYSYQLFCQGATVR